MSQPVLEALRAAINSHDPHEVAGCFTDDFLCERPLRPHEGFVGNAKVRENWTKIFAGLPDLSAEIVRHAQNGDEIWSEWEMRGTSPTGATALLRGPVILTARGDRIGWARFYLDPVTHQGDTSITVSRTIGAPASAIFALLADPGRHRDIDASGTIVRAGTDRILTAVGDTFTMAMRNDLGDDYQTVNHVVAFEADRVIGWDPSGPGSNGETLGQRFSWRLEPVDRRQTEVTQTYDWSAITFPPAIPHLPVRSVDDLNGSLHRLQEILS